MITLYNKSPTAVNSPLPLLWIPESADQNTGKYYAKYWTTFGIPIKRPVDSCKYAARHLTCCNWDITFVGEGSVIIRYWTQGTHRSDQWLQKFINTEATSSKTRISNSLLDTYFLVRISLPGAPLRLNSYHSDLPHDHAATFLRVKLSLFLTKRHILKT